MAGSRIIGGVRNETDSGQLCLPVGPSLSIAITDGDRGASWLLDIDVELDQSGSFRLGSIVTTPPAVLPPAARLVGVAFCPGAVRWRVFSTRLAGAAHCQAELELSTSPCCPGFVGLLPVAPFATPGAAAVLALPAVVVGVAAVVLASPQSIRSVVVQADAANTADVFIGGSAVTVGDGLRLRPGENESIDVERAELVYAISSAAAQTVRVQVVR